MDTAHPENTQKWYSYVIPAELAQYLCTSWMMQAFLFAEEDWSRYEWAQELFEVSYRIAGSRGLDVKTRHPEYLRFFSLNDNEIEHAAFYIYAYDGSVFVTSEVPMSGIEQESQTEKIYTATDNGEFYEYA